MRLPYALVVPALMLSQVGACKREAAVSAEAKPDAGVAADVDLSEAALAAARLEYATVTLVPRSSAVTALGRLDFSQPSVARVGPLFDGRVASLAVKPGDHVKRGAALGTIDSLDVGRSRADFVSAVARRERADAELTRERAMMEQQLTTQRRLLEAETERRLTDLDVRAAGERLRAVGVVPSAVTGRDATGAGPSTSLALTTPIDGEVMEVNARAGQPVRSQDTLFVIGNLDELWLIVQVYERDLQRVHVGDKVSITTVARPGRVFEGAVEHLHGEVDAARRVVDARIRLANADHALLPGMSAVARIHGVTEPDAGEARVLAVPRAAVQLIDGQPYVFVERGRGKFDLRPIERGVELEGLVEIVRGARAGERVATDGSFLLKAEVLREQMGKND